MNVKWRVLALAALVLFASFSAAFADDQCRLKCGMAKYEKAKMADNLDFEKKFYYKAHYILENDKEIGLSDDQIDKIKELKYTVKRSAILKEADILALALDIQKALEKDAANAAAIKALIDKKYEAKKAKAKEFLTAYLDLRALLTKDQYEKLKNLCQAHAKGEHDDN